MCKRCDQRLRGNPEMLLDYIEAAIGVGMSHPVVLEVANQTVHVLGGDAAKEAFASVLERIAASIRAIPPGKSMLEPVGDVEEKVGAELDRIVAEASSSSSEGKDKDKDKEERN